MKTPTMAVQAANGRWFAVRYLRTGARYGFRNAKVNDDADMVEFWDLTQADDTYGDHGDPDKDTFGFGPLGQFTGGRYPRSHVAR